DPGFSSAGTFTSSIKDSNPASGAAAHWNSLSWTADTPTGTAIQFQVAASNNAAGPFSFVGPDGTATTFFTNGGSLAQFTGNRYLKYQTSLNSGSGAASPTLHDVTVCFDDNTGSTSLAVAAATASYGGMADLSATLTFDAIGVSGKTISFTLNGSSVGSTTTDASGVATIVGVSLTGIAVGNYPVAATFAGDGAYTSSNGTAALTLNPATVTASVISNPNKMYN